MLAWYQARMASHPWSTGMLTASVVGVAGDSLIQVTLEEKPMPDPRRLLETAVVRAGFGAFMRAYYLRLEKVCAGWPMLAKLALNELVGTWIVHAFLLFWNAVVRRQDVRAAVALTPELAVKGMSVWPISNFISWTFVPIPLRSLWNNLVSVALAYSAVAARKRKQQK